MFICHGVRWMQCDLWFETSRKLQIRTTRNLAAQLAAHIRSRKLWAWRMRPLTGPGASSLPRPTQ
jgi:hypothetical protein